MKQFTRQELEQQKFTFLPGRITDDGRFLFDDAPPDHTPPMLLDLLTAQFVLVPGGIMEPPKTNPWLTVAGMALLGVGVFAVSKFLERKFS